MTSCRACLLASALVSALLFALLVLSGHGKAVDAPIWLGQGSAALAFLLVGTGRHLVQTVGLALATVLVKEKDHPKVVGRMYVMLLLGQRICAPSRFRATSLR